MIKLRVLRSFEVDFPYFARLQPKAKTDPRSTREDRQEPVRQLQRLGPRKQPKRMPR